MRRKMNGNMADKTNTATEGGGKSWEGWEQSTQKYLLINYMIPNKHKRMIHSLKT